MKDSYYIKFIRKQSLLVAILWGFIFFIYCFAKVYGFAKAYPTLEAREKIAHLFSSSSGLNILTGPPNNIQTIAGYTVWSSYMFVILLGSIWAILLFSKYLRGEEQDGHIESILSGKTTLTRLTKLVHLGLMESIFVSYLIFSICLIGLGKMSIISLGVTSILFFSLSIYLAIILFGLIASLTSQLMTTKRQASSLGLVILFIFSVLKALGDTSASYKWLLDISPLGWFEKLSPLQEPKFVWLIPILISMVIIYSLTIWLAPKRDLGEGIINITPKSKSQLWSLKNIWVASFRLNKGQLYIWVSAVVGINFIYGLLAKLATNALNQSPKYLNAVHKISNSSNVTAVMTFASVVFFVDMIVVGFLLANYANNLKRDETSSLDVNFLMEPVSRIKLLSSKLIVATFGLILISLLSAVIFWLGSRIGGTDSLSLSKLYEASFNALFPSLFILGLVVFMYGLLPRIGNFIVYGIVIFSVIIGFIGTDLKLNHILRDFSIFTHVNLAPATSPDWHKNILILVISGFLVIFGALLYKRRDLIND